MIIFSKRKGFTLIELLVVISIIGLLSSVIFSALYSARMKAQDVRRREDIVQIQRALELYYDANGQYPPSANGGTVPNGGWSNSGNVSWTVLGTALKPYIPSLPKDPSDNGTFGGFSYSYYTTQGGVCGQQWYMLVYNLKTASGVDPGITSCGTPGIFYQYGGSGANTSTKTIGTNSH